jgi:hypothetical protein
MVHVPAASSDSFVCAGKDRERVFRGLLRFLADLWQSLAQFVGHVRAVVAGRSVLAAEVGGILWIPEQVYVEGHVSRS